MAPVSAPPITEVEGFHEFIVALSNRLFSTQTKYLFLDLLDPLHSFSTILISIQPINQSRYTQFISLDHRWIPLIFHTISFYLPINLLICLVPLKPILFAQIQLSIYLSKLSEWSMRFSSFWI